MRSGRRAGRIFAYVALAAFALQLFGELAGSHFDAESDLSFTVPASMTSSALGLDSDMAAAEPRSFVQGNKEAHGNFRGGRTTARAVPLAGIGAKVLSAMGAGAVASVIQAALSAVGEPIVNRVLVKRMKIMDAIREVKPSMMLNYFKTTLITNFLKFPFFEGINALCAALPIDPSVRGFITGFVFTSATLPVTNYRYRKSMQLEVNWGNLYEAYWPTVIRDIAYGIVRNWSTIGVLGLNSSWKATSPQVLFIVVILGCLGSAPFNEWRGFLLQSKGKELTFKEFFNPMNCVRSTTLGALKQGLALAVGYWCAPGATKFVNGLLASFKH